MTRKTDGIMRVNKTLSLDARIFLSAEKSNMHPARFIEALYKKAALGDFPDSMPIEEMQEKYVELDRTLRALGFTIAQRKEEAKKKDEEKAVHSDEDQAKMDKAILAVTDNLLKSEEERIKTPRELAELRAEMLKTGTQGRITLSPDELLMLAQAKIEQRKAELAAEAHLNEVRARLPPKAAE